MSAIGREELLALAEKYETLAAMRRREAAGEPPHENVFYQRLAARFPGALKELDRLPLEEIDRRARELRAAHTGAPAAWMIAVSAYHARLRELLMAKRRGEVICESGPCSIVALATTAAAETSGLDAAEVRTLLALKRRI